VPGTDADIGISGDPDRDIRVSGYPAGNLFPITEYPSHVPRKSFTSLWQFDTIIYIERGI